MLWTLWIADVWPYVVCVVALVCISVHFGLRYKYGFWLYQPVLLDHMRWKYLFARDQTLTVKPEAAKFHDFKLVTTSPFLELGSVQQQRFASAFFAPLTREQVWAQWNSTSLPSLISLRTRPCNRVDAATQLIVSEQELVGWCAARPMQLWFLANDLEGINNNSLLTETGPAGFDPYLLSTHWHNQRQLLAEREHYSGLTVLAARHQLLPSGVVPFCVYPIVRFVATAAWRQPPPLSGEYKLVPINRSNGHFFLDFVSEMRQQFDAAFVADIGNLMAQLETQTLHIVALLCDDIFQSVYFFRRRGVQVDDGSLELLTCSGSLCRCDDAVFAHAFKVSLWDLAAKHRYGGCEMDGVAHNGKLIRALQQNTAAHSTSGQGAYYFHGAAILPAVPGERLLVIV